MEAEKAINAAKAKWDIATEAAAKADAKRKSVEVATKEAESRLEALEAAIALLQKAQKEGALPVTVKAAAPAPVASPKGTGITISEIDGKDGAANVAVGLTGHPFEKLGDWIGTIVADAKGTAQAKPENNKKVKVPVGAKASAKDSKKGASAKAEEKSTLVDSHKTKASMAQIDNTIFNMKLHNGKGGDAFSLHARQGSDDKQTADNSVEASEFAPSMIKGKAPLKMLVHTSTGGASHIGANLLAASSLVFFMLQ
jgi:hypothetical protein